MSELPPDPPRLRAILAHLEQQLANTETIRTYLRLQRDEVQAALAAADRPTRTRAPSPTRPPTRASTGYVLERKIRTNHPMPPLVHVADCTMPRRRTEPITAEKVREALTNPADPPSMEECVFCRPSAQLEA
ncbi:DUF6233 domain-containing protein [Streptomyces sp. NBC_01356]|uniref:DUF6233 domain-containing protein n=1 Tax=Streptomyces sp. NBC_01356 TaxID=2903836 RepID=UPI002E32219F|nr:DUF6233 domain-containing protein [Streptomyces sp. NBC_01356]